MALELCYVGNALEAVIHLRASDFIRLYLLASYKHYLGGWSGEGSRLMTNSAILAFCSALRHTSQQAYSDSLLRIAKQSPDSHVEYSQEIIEPFKGLQSISFSLQQVC